MDECHECGGPVIEERGPQDVQVGTYFVAVQADYSRCTSCGEVTYAGGQVRAMEIAAVDIVRRENDLLEPAEIKAIRAQYGFSESDLEQLIRAHPPKAIVRWERGTQAPSGPADTLLRILRDHPDMVEQLARERGVPVRLDPDQQAGAGMESR